MKAENHSRKKVLVAMSGGVDSSVAAALMVKAGYDVVGVHLKFWADMDGSQDGGHLSVKENKCCSIESAQDARRVASMLGFPFYVLDCREYFKENIVEYFLQAYEADMTPNPCVLCNRKVKFGFLHDKMQEFGADYIASGHYAQIIHNDGNPHLMRGMDNTKDQSYFLYNIRKEYLKDIIYPIGGMHKDQVRSIAADLGLRIAQKHDSQELCFVGGQSHHTFLQKWMQQKLVKGDIVTQDGQVIGQHDGLLFYTVGQRKGINTRIPRAWYVVRKDVENNRLVVGDMEDTAVVHVVLEQCNFLVDDIASWKDITVQYRYRSTPLPVKSITFNKEGNTCEVVMDKKAMAVSKGQAGVLYSGNILLGGGIIHHYT